MFREYPDILTIPQVAQALVKQQRLGAIYIGRTIKVPKDELVAFVKSARNNVVL